MLETLFDPNVAFVMLVVGMVLAVLAILTPGTGMLEIGAGFTLFLAAYGIYHLPTNPWAFAILLVGVALFFLSIKRPRQWIILILAIAALICGSIFMFQGSDRLIAINPFLAGSVAAVSGGFLWLIARYGFEAIRSRPTHDSGRLIGEEGEALTDIFTEGSAYISGENWSARSELFIPVGSKVRVVKKEGLTLIVELAQSLPGIDQ